MVGRIVLGAALVIGIGGGDAAFAKPEAKAKPAAPDDAAARAAYRAGMKKGRKATDAKKWADALAGFDAALAAKPGDPRALGERGFARLLEGKDLDAATRDFDQAAGSTNDSKLLSEIWFNRGIVEEKRGNAANALAAFVVANSLRPTKAAQAKITGKGTCPVTVARNLGDALVPEHTALDAADWLAMWELVPHDESDRPKTNAEAAKLLTEEKEPSLPGAFTARSFEEDVSFVVWKRAGKLHALPIEMSMGGRCPGFANIGLVTADAKYAHVHTSTMFDGGYTFMCDGKDGERVECSDKPGEVQSGTACFGGSKSSADYVVDLASGKVVISADQPEAKGEAKVELVANGLKLTGLGCDRVEPFSK